MRIENGKLVIRNAEVFDAGQLALWWNDGKVMNHAGFPYGLGITEEEIAAGLKTDSDTTRRRLILEYCSCLIGEMSYRMLPEQTAEIGIKICKEEYQERGLGRIALSLLIRELFRMGCKKIILDTNIKNTRAQHVYEKLGFQKIRVNYDSWTDQTGVLQSSVDYELKPIQFHDWSL